MRSTTIRASSAQVVDPAIQVRQVYNPVTKKWTKRDSDTGEFMDVKEDGEPFKGVRKER